MRSFEENSNIIKFTCTKTKIHTSNHQELIIIQALKMTTIQHHFMTATLSQIRLKIHAVLIKVSFWLQICKFMVFIYRKSETGPIPKRAKRNPMAISKAGS